MFDLNMSPEGSNVCLAGSPCLSSWVHDSPSMSSRLGFVLSNFMFLAWFIIISALSRSRQIYASISYGLGVWGTNSKIEGHNGVPLFQRLGARTFNTTMAASGVLALLILCEVTESLNPNARKLWFQGIIWLLVFSLVVVVPLLQLHGVLSATRTTRRKQWLAHLELGLLLGLFLGWLCLFWLVGRWMPVMELDEMYWWGCRFLKSTSTHHLIMGGRI